MQFLHADTDPETVAMDEPPEDESRLVLFPSLITGYNQRPEESGVQ